MNEKGNTITHLAGTLFALSSVWMLWPAANKCWEMTLGIAMFLTGMFLMFLSSTLYHWVRPGQVKTALRKCDHICIYIMIAGSYSPICISVIGGVLGWSIFALQWFMVVVGAIYKIAALGRYPKLSLAIYLTMGWSIILIAPEVYNNLSLLPLCLILSEGILYTIGTYFFSHDTEKYYHTIWHIFVLLGAIAHCGAVLAILFEH